MKKIVFIYFVLTMFLPNIFAQELKDRVNMSGSIFSDYFYNVDNVIDSLKDLNGFQISRIFFTTDFILSESFDARFRLECNQTSSSLTSGGKIGVMVKDAFLKWKNIFEGSDLIFGLSPTPIYEISEFWGYRSLEKSPTDLLGIIPFRDIGVDLKGKLTENGKLNYHVKIGNNSNNAPEVNKYKRYYALIHFKSLDGVQLGLYGDYSSMPNKLDPVDDKNKNNDQLMSSFFFIYSYQGNYSIGANTFLRLMQNNFYNSPTQILQNQSGVGCSLWAWYKLSDKFRIVARMDQFDPNLDNTNDATTLIISGLDYSPVRSVSIIPNFELFTYQGIDSKDLTVRLTFTYQY